MDVFGYLETVKYRYRMDAVDLWNGFFIDRSDSVYKLADKSYIRKIREALDEKEMRVVNFAVDGAHLWDPDPDIRQKLYENALVHLDAAEILGAETVRIDTGGSYKESEPMTYEQFEYTVKRYREYADRAADGGYTIGPENHMGASLLPREMKRLAEEVHHPAFGFLLHLGRWKADEAEGDEMVAHGRYILILTQKQRFIPMRRRRCGACSQADTRVTGASNTMRWVINMWRWNGLSVPSNGS